MEESDIAAFRLRYRLELLERLVLKTAFAGPLLAQVLSVADSKKALKDWLDANSAVADATFGTAFQDPAMAALYADEVKDLIEKMKKTVDELAAVAPRELG